MTDPTPDDWAGYTPKDYAAFASAMLQSSMKAAVELDLHSGQMCDVHVRVASQLRGQHIRDAKDLVELMTALRGLQDAMDADELLDAQQVDRGSI